jgi:hypothetical protein
MATVTTPVGQTLTGVTGDELEYYRGEANTREGYVIVEDDSRPSSSTVFPQVFEGGERVELPEAPVAVEVEQLPEGQVANAVGPIQTVDGQPAGEGTEVPQNPDGTFGPAEVSNDPANSPKPRH